MPLQLDSLRSAVGALHRAVQTSGSLPDSANRDLRETVRAGVIQNFEVAYEQCWKMMQRWIRENKSPEEAEFPRTRKELFRKTAQYGLIADPLPWFDYGEARNQTSHTYDEAKAISAYDTALRFLTDAQDFLQRIEKLND